MSKDKRAEIVEAVQRITGLTLHGGASGAFVTPSSPLHRKE